MLNCVDSLALCAQIIPFTNIDYHPLPFVHDVLAVAILHELFTD